MKVAVGARTDVGRMRDNNQDAFRAEEPLFVIADGMGGHLGGDVASSTAIETIFSRLGSDGEVDATRLAEIVRAANQAIWDRSQRDPSLRGMGTTLTLVFLDDRLARVVHVGDSRLYLMREGVLNQLSEDHTLVGQMVREGRLSEQEARYHPQRNVITRALGVDPDVRVDSFAIDLVEGDVILICSDGLTSMLDNDTIRDVLTRERAPQRAADELVRLANEAGGEDNITVIVLDTRPEALAAQDRAGSTAETAAVRSERTDAPPPSDGAVEAREHRPPGTWGRRLALGLGVVVLLGAAAYGGIRYWLTHSWFVGVDPGGAVTIYQGVDGEVAGFDLATRKETTALQLSDLPQFKRSDVRDGIPARSLSDARDKVAALRHLARQFKQRRTGSRHHRTSASGSGGGTP